MKTKNKIFWITYIYLLALVLIRLIPIIAPESRSWGFNHLIFLPDIYSYAFFAVAIIALLIPFFKFSEKAGKRIAEWFSDKFLDGKYRNLYRILFVAVMTTLFAIFTAPTHFLGDGYSEIKNLTSKTGILVKWSEIGIIQLMWTIRELLGPPNKETSQLAFRIVSICSGAVSIYFMFLISLTILEDNIKRFIVFIAAFFSGILLLFFGYAEYYPIIWVFMTGFIYFSLNYLKSDRGLILAWLFLIIGVILHIQMVVFIPAAVYMIFSKGNGLILYGRFKKLIWGAVGLVIISCFTLLIYKYMTNLYVEDIFLPLFTGKPVYPEYALLSVPHLLDIINEFILVSPLLFLLILIGGNNLKNIFKNKIAIFFGLGAVGTLLFLFVIDPKLAFPRDWDLFSISCFPLMLLSVTLINKNRFEYIGKLLIPIMLILSVYSLPFLLTNLHLNRSEKYIESLIELDTSKSMSSFTVLSRYYKDNNDRGKFDALIAKFNRKFMQDRIISSAFDAVVTGDLELAQKYYQFIKPDKFNGDYLRLSSMMYYTLGQYEKALDNINGAIQLRKFASEYYFSRAKIYFALTKYDFAIIDLREAIHLDPIRINFLDALAYVFDLTKQPDSCVYYAKETLKLDSTRFPSYRYIVKWFALAGQMEKAQKYKDLYIRFSLADSTQTRNLELLDSLI